MAEHASVPAVPGLRHEVGSIVVPGDRIASVRTVKSGVGTYVKAGNVYASVVGKLQIAELPGPANPGANSKSHAQSPTYYVVTVKTKRPISSMKLLAVGQIAIGRITRITMLQALVDVLATTSVTGEAVLLDESQEGSIRREDIRSGASEQVQVHESFLPGDLVICKVLAVGDQRRYVLATSEPELGVLYAVSQTSGMQMVPCSWKDMICPDTGAKEPRKCAKPRVLSITSDGVSSS
jgi:exosome complex component CSL4